VKDIWCFRLNGEIATSPDGRELLLGVGNPRPDVWTLSGFGAAPGSGR
jgi:hypothetical protein